MRQVHDAELARFPANGHLALDAEGLRLFDQVEREVTVRGESREFGVVALAHRWRGPAGGPPAAPEAPPA